MSDIPAGNDGGSIEDSTSYQYACALLDEDLGPVVIPALKVRHEGRAFLYTAAHVPVEDRDIELAESDNDRVRAMWGAGALIRATREIGEMNEDPEHHLHDEIEWESWR